VPVVGFSRSHRARSSFFNVSLADRESLPATIAQSIIVQPWPVLLFCNLQTPFHNKMDGFAPNLLPIFKLVGLLSVQFTLAEGSSRQDVERPSMRVHRPSAHRYVPELCRPNWASWLDRSGS
jgi:hypothetical protein